MLEAREKALALLQLQMRKKGREKSKAMEEMVICCWSVRPPVAKRKG